MSHDLLLQVTSLPGTSLDFEQDMTINSTTVNVAVEASGDLDEARGDFIRL